MTEYSRCSSTKLFFLWQATNTRESARPKYKNLHQTHRILRISHTQIQPTTSYIYICMIINGIGSHTFSTYIKRVFSRLFRCFEDRTTLTMSFNLLIFTQRLFASNFFFSFSVFLTNLPYFQIWEHDHLHTVTTMSIQCTTHESDKASIPIMNHEWRMDPWFTTTLTSYSIAIILSFDFHVHNLHRTGPSIPQSGWLLKF